MLIQCGVDGGRGRERSGYTSNGFPFGQREMRKSGPITSLHIQPRIKNGTGILNRFGDLSCATTVQFLV